MQNMTFRNSKIVYYGPHPCQHCGVAICRMGAEYGGNAFTYPDGPVYPNTEWHVHVCDPVLVRRQAAHVAKERVFQHHNGAFAEKQGDLGWQIVVRMYGDNAKLCLTGGTYSNTPETAWIVAKQNLFPNEGEVG